MNRIRYALRTGWVAGAGLLMCMVLFAGCDTGDTGGKPKVVATFSVLGDLTEQVGGDHIELVTLVGPDGDAHTFEPTPQDTIALANADVIVEIGLGFETWLDGMADSSRTRARRAVVTDGIDLIEADEDDEHGHDEHDHDHHDHHHGEYDPHVWHDAENAIYMVGKIRDALSEADPAHAADYSRNADPAIARLRELNAWVTQQVETLPEERRKLVTSHDTFGYFAKRYGFRTVGTALGSFSTEAADPSGAELAELCDAIRHENVPAVFGENVKDSRLMERVAKETGVQVVPTLYTDALGSAGSSGENYEKMMRHNVTTIVGALGK